MGRGAPNSCIACVGSRTTSVESFKAASLQLLTKAGRWIRGTDGFLQADFHLDRLRLASCRGERHHS